MGSRARTVWMVGAVLVGGVALAAARSGSPGEGSEGASDAAAAKAGGPALPVGALDAALGTGEKKRIRLDPELATALHRVGLQPDRLTAAGVSAEVTDDVVGNVKSWLAEHPTSLSAADEALFAATKTRDELFRKVRSGKRSQEDVAACPTAKADHDAALAARDAVLAAVFAEGTDGLVQEQITLLSRLQQHAAAWNIPLEYLVAERTQQEWVALRSALANERISAKYGEDPDEADQALLTNVRAEVEVAAAKVNLDTKLGEVTAVWEAAAAAEEQ